MAQTLPPILKNPPIPRPRGEVTQGLSERMVRVDAEEDSKRRDEEGSCEVGEGSCGRAGGQGPVPCFQVQEKRRLVRVEQNAQGPEADFRTV